MIIKKLRTKTYDDTDISKSLHYWYNRSLKMYILNVSGVNVYDD